MPRGYWGILSALGVALTGSLIIGWLIWPDPPALQTYSYERARSTEYQAGGVDCAPEALASLGKGGNATRKRQYCAEEAENHRLQTNDLIQQTRAADAAEAQADLAVQAAWTAFFQTIGGFLTLVAAGAAAIYARDAAAETRRGADAAHTAVQETRAANSIAQSVDRPWVKITGIIEAIKSSNNFIQLRLHIVAQNVGRMAAVDTQVEYNAIDVPKFINELESRIAQLESNDNDALGYITVLPGDERSDNVSFTFELSSRTIYGEQKPRIRAIVLVVCRYKVPGETHFRHSTTAWLVRRVRPPTFLPPNYIVRPNIGLLITELPTIRVEDLKLSPVRVRAT